MGKKRGPKVSSKKLVRKTQARKGRGGKKPEEKAVKQALHKLEILAEEKKVEENINAIKKREEGIEKKETEIIGEEKKIEDEAEKVEKLEKEIERGVMTKPLTKLNIKDLNKAIIGAFIGVVAHFAFIYGKEIARNISTARATFLIIFSYLVIIILMYETGYRVIKEKRLFGIFPKRATVIYLTSITVIIVIFFLFDQINLSDITGTYKQIAVTSILAALGAGTADLIGRN